MSSDHELLSYRGFALLDQLQLLWVPEMFLLWQEWTQLWREFLTLLVVKLTQHPLEGLSRHLHPNVLTHIGSNRNVN